MHSSDMKAAESRRNVSSDWPPRRNHSSLGGVRLAVLMACGTFISRVLGLVRDMVIGAFFSRTHTDAFFVAFRAPNFFRRFLGEGALSISFIPVFIQCLSESSEGKEGSVVRARNFVNSVYTIMLIMVGVLTVVGIIFMDPLLRALFANTAFADIEGKVRMVTMLARWLFVYLFLVTLYAYFMGIANALGSFFIPAVAPALLNVCIIIFSLVPHSIVSLPPLLLCWGVLLGGVLQVLLTAVVLYRLGFLPSLTWQFSRSDLKVMGVRFLPGLLGMGGFSVISLLNLYFAAWLEEGAHTFIYYGDRLLELPRSLIAISLGAALLPNLSYFMVAGKRDELSDSAAWQRDILLFLIVPCALGFWYLGLPIVDVLFRRGLFDEDTTRKTALVLQIYSVLLITSSLSRVLATCFYAVRNVWYPALACFLYIVFHWCFTPFMIDWFGLEGLVWATVVSNAFFMSLLLFAYPFYVGCLHVWRTIQRWLWSVPALVLLYLYLHFSVYFFPSLWLVKEDRVSTSALVFVILSSIILYIGVGWLLRVPQALECMRLASKKAKSVKT